MYVLSPIDWPMSSPVCDTAKLLREKSGSLSLAWKMGHKNLFNYQ